MEDMFLIVGLGNPGSKYAETRHNVGFMAIERFGDRCRAQWRMEDRFEARLARCESSKKRLVLCEPQTYMNNSGVAVQAVAAFYKIAASRLLVIVDDADLPFGQIRLRQSGSPGGHHGLESVERCMNTRDYARLRIGIGRQTPGVRDISNYVLGRFTTEENPTLSLVLGRVVDQIECWLAYGIEKAMNQFNGAVKAPMSKES